MSEDPNQPETPEEEAPPRRGCLTRMLPTTTPGCASCLTTVFLFITVATVATIFLLDPDNVPWRHSMSWLRIASVIALMFIIPWVVYRLLNLWLEGVASPFPDLEYAWYSGLEALAVNGLSINSAPVYLILGSASEQQEKAMLAAAGLRMRVEGVPEGPAPLHWYANPDGIYLFCSDASWTSALASLREELIADAAGRGLTASESPMLADLSSAASSPAPTPAPAPPEPEAQDAGSIRGTIMLDQYGASQESPTPAPQTPASGGDQAASGFRGTIELDAGTPTGQTTQSGRGASPATALGGDDLGGVQAAMEPVLVSPQYSSACLQELQYLCQLLRRARQPVCPVNGVLTLLQYEAIYSSPAETEELQKAIKADLATMQYALQLRSPVSALVVGLEKERGFRELVRRVGRERAASQRFGRKFDVRAVPTEEELEALTAHVCGAFEDWAYTLFREEEALTRPGNTRLYELLSKVRCSWKTRLGDILAGGFGCEHNGPAQAESLFFSGCYFAATGDTPDRQAFVRGVMDKLKDEQEWVEWTATALRANRVYSRLASLGVLLVLILAASFVGMCLFDVLTR